MPSAQFMDGVFGFGCAVVRVDAREEIFGGRRQTDGTLLRRKLKIWREEICVDQESEILAGR